jgi:hypothetical protein
MALSDGGDLGELGLSIDVQYHVLVCCSLCANKHRSSRTYRMAAGARDCPANLEMTPHLVTYFLATVTYLYVCR